jgi:outer membrane protein assembly factor BamB
MLPRPLLFLFSLALLVVLSGSSLWYFGFLLPRIRTPTMFPAQTATATATAAARAYATAVARQGVMEGFDAAHTNDNPYERILGLQNVSRLKLLWSFAATGRSSIFSIFSPTVAGAMVYGDSEDGTLYVFDATCRQKCQPLWSFTTGGSIWSSPTVADGMIYVGSFGSADHKLYALGLMS